MKLISKEGKYQTAGPKPAARKSAVKKSLMQTYLTSLLSLVLSVSMFLSTTAAWFTDAIETTGNQIMVGTLNVDLYHASYKGGVLTQSDDATQAAEDQKVPAVEGMAKVTSSHKIFDEDIVWEPGYTAVEQFTILEGEDNNLPFTYEMTLKSAALENAHLIKEGINEASDENKAEAEKLIRMADEITVWSYTGPGLGEKLGYTSFAELSGDMVDDQYVWQKVGTLYEVMIQHLPVFKNVMNNKDVNDHTPGAKTHTIALHVNEKCGNEADIQGLSLSDITITLLATQISSGNDAFSTPANSKPVQIYDVETAPVSGDQTTKDVTLVGVDFGSGVHKATVTVPAGAKVTENAASGLKLTITGQENDALVNGQTEMALDIKVEGLANGEGQSLITVALEINPKLTNLKVKHENEFMKKLESANEVQEGYFYDAESGVLTIKTTGFSNYSICYGTVASTDQAVIADALSKGYDVRLNGNMLLSQNLVMDKGGMLNGNGKTVQASPDSKQSYDCLITTTGGVVKNLTITGGNGLGDDKIKTRAIGTGSSGVYKLNQDLLLDNVTIDNVQYAINGSGTGNETVTVKNSDINGWCSFANLKQLSFENCKLGSGNSYLGYLVVYGDTTFKNCHFETVVENKLDRNFWLGSAENIKTYPEGTEIVIDHCTYGNQTVTADNFRDLFCYAGDEDCFNVLSQCKVTVRYTDHTGKLVEGVVDWSKISQPTT